jgi:pimeloyl-ACP methyl ester carboxylesterase
MRVAESRIARSTQCEIYYEVYGDGPLVLILPGGEENALHFCGNIPSFVRAGYRVAVMNLRGHFQSPCEPLYCHPRFFVDDIDAVMQSEGDDQVFLVGESLGGFGAMRFAVQHPQKTRSLILMGTGAGVYSDSNFASTANACAMYLDSIRASEPRQVDFHDPDAERALFSRNITMLGSADGSTSAPLSFLTTMTDQHWWLKPEDLVSYSVPTMIVGGDSDVFLGVGFQRHLATLIPGAELGSLQQCGHRPYWECPAEFNACAIAYFDRFRAE